ncbi:MAG: hypothetical protein AAGJ37_08405 [Pseudomonadota bacterium]
MKILLSAFLATTISTSVFANEWEPLAAESLVQLPANLIEKRIEQDFRLSPAASKINELELKLVNQSSAIKAVQATIDGSDDTQMIDEKVELVKLKSAFLDDMQEGQMLRQNALDKRVALYQQVLTEFFAREKQNADSVTFKMKEQQQLARERMQNVMAQVDDAFTQQGLSSTTPYADEFAKNLAKIEQLKEAIKSHRANLSPMVDGVEVSSQEYIRQLLVQAASEQSLLDQEALMLSYMSRLVALDAQALEYAINIDAEEQEGAAANASTTPATSVELFL